MKFISTLLLLFICILSHAQHYDWPMWRFDHNRSASTPEQLADKLYLQWQIKYPARIPVWDDPLNQNLMQYDRLFEPIVAGNKMFIGFNDQDKVIALELNSGKELWHFYADGPVRLPLASNNGKIYFTGDDGYCYCLNADNGSLIWKRLLAPSEGKLLGNKRLISLWPARGGIVIKDNIIYTAASIFPMMGTFIYALDAETGDVIWKNEGTGSNYILQPHRSPAFADVAPQGSFTISGDKLLVAGGRTVPAAFDLKTGEEVYFHLAESGKTGGSFTCGNDAV
jgi:outer membrane protein assembly factor BamB